MTPQPPDTGWHEVQPGVEGRSLNVAAGELTERVTIARLDPLHVTLRVFYTPGNASLVSTWAQQTGALLVVNGGYFTAEQMVTGLTVTDGAVYGVPYGDYAGMLAVAMDGVISVRWLRTWPYDVTEPLREAIQSFPVLVKPGGEMGFPADADDGRASRRTVVAQDRQGRLLLMIAPRGYLSLHELAVWLAESDLDIEIALNLDGGTSSGFWLNDNVQVDSMIPVPVVVGVFPR
jgi:exopolysaccharide biosynthesis protein